MHTTLTWMFSLKSGFFFYVGAFRQADHKRRCIKLGSMCRKATENYVESCSHSDLMDIMQHFLSETEMDDSWSITYLGLHATLQLGHKYRQLRHKVSGRRPSSEVSQWFLIWLFYAKISHAFYVRALLKGHIWPEYCTKANTKGSKGPDNTLWMVKGERKTCLD